MQDDRFIVIQGQPKIENRSNASIDRLIRWQLLNFHGFQCGQFFRCEWSVIALLPPNNVLLSLATIYMHKYNPWAVAPFCESNLFITIFF